MRRVGRTGQQCSGGDTAPDPSTGVPRDGGSGDNGWLPSDWGIFMAAPGTKARDRLGCGHSVKKKKQKVRHEVHTAPQPHHRPELSPIPVELAKGRKKVN